MRQSHWERTGLCHGADVNAAVPDLLPLQVGPVRADPTPMRARPLVVLLAGAVAAAVVSVEGEYLDLASLRKWASDRLSTYKLPKRLAVVDEFPRNAMGKVMKPAVKELFLDG